VNSHYWLFTVDEVKEKIIMAILLDEEKVVKIVKYDFLVKMKLMLEMA
jgi:hypothetical protein